jgi:hypothetical protein
MNVVTPEIYNTYNCDSRPLSDMNEPSYRFLDLPAELRCEYTYPASLVPIA